MQFGEPPIPLEMKDGRAKHRVRIGVSGIDRQRLLRRRFGRGIRDRPGLDTIGADQQFRAGETGIRGSEVRVGANRGFEIPDTRNQFTRAGVGEAGDPPLVFLDCGKVRRPLPACLAAGAP